MLVVYGTKMTRTFLLIKLSKFFFVDDLVRGRNWRVVHNVHHRQIWENIDTFDDTVDVDVVHDTNSCNFTLFVDLGELIVQHTNQQPRIIDVSQSSDEDEDEDDDEDEDEDEDEDDLLVEHLDDEIQDASPTNLLLSSDDDCD